MWPSKEFGFCMSHPPDPRSLHGPILIVYACCKAEDAAAGRAKAAPKSILVGRELYYLGMAR